MNSLVEKNFPERSGPNPKDRVWNVLTLVLLLGTVGLIGVFALTFTNPQNSLNPFPPPTATPINPTATPIHEFPPTWTPTPWPTRAAAKTPPPPGEAGSPATAAVVTVQAVPTAAPGGQGGYSFQLRGEPILVSAAISHPEEGCQWMGVGGEVFDLQSSPLVGVTIQMGGSLSRRAVNLLSLTGTATQYGPAGYEFNLGKSPVDSQGTLWLQLLDQAGLPLSDRVSINTSSDCNQNLVLVSFKQVR